MLIWVRVCASGTLNFHCRRTNPVCVNKTIFLKKYIKILIKLKLECSIFLPFFFSLFHRFLIARIRPVSAAGNTCTSTPHPSGYHYHYRHHHHHYHSYHRYQYYNHCFYYNRTSAYGHFRLIMDTKLLGCDQTSKLPSRNLPC